MLTTGSVVLACSPASLTACNEVEGLEQLELGQYDAAYKLLAPCENRPDVSPDTLLALAVVYGVRDFPGKSDAELESRTWTLLHRAALSGSLDATIEIAQLYQVGSRLINVDPNERRSQCLDTAAELASDLMRGAAVAHCLQGD